MTTLWINDIKMDLGDARITETRQINTFLELKDRQTSFTNKFILPETARNVYHLEMFGATGDTSTIPNQRNRSSVYRRGVPSIENGEAIIQQRKYGKGYPINIQFGNNNLFDLIGSNKVSDLDFSSINHVFTTDTIINSFSNTWLEGYMYTLADYGFINSSNEGLPVLASFQVPSVFIRYIWDLIFSTYGFTYTYVGENNIFESEEFLNKLVTIEQPKKALVGDQINFSQLFTSLSQKEFIKSVVQDFGLMYQRDQGTFEYKFITYEDFLVNNEDCVDFSGKYHKKIDVDAALKGYAQINKLSYEYDNPLDDFSDGSFEILNDTLINEKELFKSPFKAPKFTSIEVNGNNVFNLKYFDPVFNEDGSTKEVKEEKSLPYIHTFKRVSGSVTYLFNNLSRRTNNFGTPYMSFEGLTYSEIISKRYNSFISNLQKSRVFTIELTLNSLDVLSFDFFNQVYIKQLGGFFYMNKIGSFEPGKNTKCEIISIVKKSETSEYSDEFSDAFNT